MIGKNQCVRDHPISSLPCGLERVWDLELGGVDARKVADSTHSQNCDNNGEVGEKVPHIAREIAGIAERLEGETDGEGSGKEEAGHQENVRLKITIISALKKSDHTNKPPQIIIERELKH